MQTPSTPSVQTGFTLLELLVVVVLIAVMAGALVLSVQGGSSARTVDTELERVRLVVEALCDRSMLETRYLGLGLSQTQYVGYEIGASGDWQPIQREGLFKRHVLPGGLALSLVGEEAPALRPSLPDQPQLLCAPDGLPNPFVLALTAGSGTQTLRAELRRDGTGEWRRETTP